MRRSDERSLLSGFGRALFRIAIAFGLAAGGLSLAFWAFESDQPVLGWIGLGAAGTGFLWLTIMQLYYGGGGGDEGEGVGLFIFILLGGAIVGGGAMAVLGLGLIWLGVLGVIVALIWLVSVVGSVFFE